MQIKRLDNYKNFRKSQLSGIYYMNRIENIVEIIIRIMPLVD